MESQAITGHRTRRGFNLIEAAIVLGVVGLVIGGIWIAYDQFSYHYQKQKFFQGFLTFQNNANKYLTQTMPTGALVWTSPAIIDLIYPHEWKEIDLSAFLRHGLELTVTDTNGVRYLIAHMYFPQEENNTLCDETKTFLERNNIYKESAGWHCLVYQRRLMARFDISRRD